ncbi:MAG: 1-acyl-sn-glycerol-3-phosphate acyltransferase [Pseudomonadales bacterium]|nr:1-acyl-sn-glycerol-3-phosphate acyltransferase [Pseudomonadales bacterium]
MPEGQSHPVWRTVFPLYKWLVIVPFLGISTGIIGSLIAILSMLGMPNFSSRVLATRWARLNMAVSLISIDIEGTENVDPGQSYVIAANHQSLIDLYVLYGYAGMDIKWVMKKELRSIPVLGIACEAMGHIIVDRSNTEAAIESINNARDRITDGISVVFFPEGTRSRTGELKSFKKGAFRLARDLKLPILPVSIHDTNKVLPSDTMDLHPGRVKMRFHPPIPADEVVGTELGELSNKTRDIISRALNE